MRILLWLILVLGVWQYGPAAYRISTSMLAASGLPGAPAAAPSRERPNVVMYATRRCGYCTRARKFFAENDIDYEERDVDRSSSHRREWERLGARGVPTFVLGGDEVIKGWNESRLRERLL